MLTCAKDNLLKLTDWRSFQVQRSLRAPGFHVGGVWCRACLGADERHAAAGSADGTVHVWSVSHAGLHPFYKARQEAHCTRWIGNNREANLWPRKRPQDFPGLISAGKWWLDQAFGDQ